MSASSVCDLLTDEPLTKLGDFCEATLPLGKLQVDEIAPNPEQGPVSIHKSGYHPKVV